MAPADRAGAHEVISALEWKSGMDDIADVVGGELEHLGHGRSDPGHPSLAAEAGLGCSRGARREQQVPERVLGDRGPGRVGEGRALGPGHQLAVGGRLALTEVAGRGRR